MEAYLTVRETIARNAGYYPNPRDVDEVVELVGLDGHERQKVKDLSGGQKRRLDLGLGIVGNPRLLFLDEPTTGFDPAARRQAWQVVKNLQAEGTTILLTTHYMDEAQELADEIALMAGGRIVAAGPPTSIGGRDLAVSSIGFQAARRLGAGRTTAARQRPAHARGHGARAGARTDRRAPRADRLGAGSRCRPGAVERPAAKPGGHLPLRHRRRSGRAGGRASIVRPGPPS